MFPFVAGEVNKLPKRRYAVIVDEAHSSQSSESAQELKSISLPPPWTKLSKRRSNFASLPSTKPKRSALHSPAESRPISAISPSLPNLHAVRYKESIDDYIAAHGYSDMKILIAFSGVVQADGGPYTEMDMNGGIPERQFPEKFASPEYSVLIVAEKYQTGFDQPLLSAGNEVPSVHPAHPPTTVFSPKRGLTSTNTSKLPCERTA